MRSLLSYDYPVLARNYTVRGMRVVLKIPKGIGALIVQKLIILVLLACYWTLKAIDPLWYKFWMWRANRRQKSRGQTQSCVL